MRKGILLFLGILLLSCNEKVIEKPENLIPKDKMVLVLHDLALLNATKASYKAALEKNNLEVMDFLYRTYEIDSVQFAESDLYYASLPLEYQSIYEKVEALLEKRKSDMELGTKRRNDSIKETNIRRNDSILKLKQNEEVEKVKP